MWVTTKVLRLKRNVHVKGCCTWNVHSFLRAGFFWELKQADSITRTIWAACSNTLTIFTKLQSEKQLQDPTLTSPCVHALSRPQQENMLVGWRQGEINTSVSPWRKDQKISNFFHYIHITQEINMWTFVCTFINDLQVCMISWVDFESFNKQ